MSSSVSSFQPYALSTQKKQNLNHILWIPDVFSSTYFSRPRFRYRCNVCYDITKKEYNSLWSIKRHIRTHIANNKLVCTFPGCTKTFTTRCTLNRHYRQQHQQLPSAQHSQLQTNEEDGNNTKSPTQLSSSSQLDLTLGVILFPSSTKQIYPTPGLHILQKVNSVIYSGIVQSCVNTNLIGKQVIIKTVNPMHADQLGSSLRALCKEYEMHEILRDERFYIREALALIGPMIIMTYGGQHTLGDFMKHQHTQKLLQQHLQRVAYEIFSCIAACHKHGIVHRDIKPANFIVKNETAEFFHLQLIDLGLACKIGDSENKSIQPIDDYLSVLLNNKSSPLPNDILSVSIGTRGYRGPHLLLTHHCDYRDDLWSAAVIILEIALGICLYTHHVKGWSEIVSRDKWSQHVAEAVICGRYLPWNALERKYPHLSVFLRRITREEKPYFETADDVINFVSLKSNTFVFEPLTI